MRISRGYFVQVLKVNTAFYSENRLKFIIMKKFKYFAFKSIKNA